MKLQNNTIQNNKNIQLIDGVPNVDFRHMSHQFFSHNLEYDLILDRLEVSTDWKYSSFLFKNLPERYTPFIRLIPKVSFTLHDETENNIFVNNFYYTWNKSSQFDYYLNCKTMIYSRTSGVFEQTFLTLSVFIQPFINIKNITTSRL